MSNETRTRRNAGAINAEAAEGAMNEGLAVAHALRLASFWSDAMQSNLRVWRSFFDATRQTIRAEQDAMLEAFRAQLSRAGAPGASREDNMTAQGLFEPFVAAQRAYEQMGEAMIEAQRGALDAMTGAERKH